MCLVIECRALQDVRDKYPNSFGSMQMKLLWQADLQGGANFVIDSLEVDAMLAVLWPDI